MFNSLFLSTKSIAATLAQAAAGGSNYGTLIMLGGMAVIIYFFMIRPQQKQNKVKKEFVANMKKGDMVVTVGGMHGKITDLSDTAVTIDMARGVNIKFEKTSISPDSSKQYSA